MEQPVAISTICFATSANAARPGHGSRRPSPAPRINSANSQNNLAARRQHRGPSRDHSDARLRLPSVRRKTRPCRPSPDCVPEPSRGRTSHPAVPARHPVCVPNASPARRFSSRGIEWSRTAASRRGEQRHDASSSNRLGGDQRGDVGLAPVHANTSGLPARTMPVALQGASSRIASNGTPSPPSCALHGVGAARFDRQFQPRKPSPCATQRGSTIERRCCATTVAARPGARSCRPAPRRPSSTRARSFGATHRPRVAPRRPAPGPRRRRSGSCCADSKYQSRSRPAGSSSTAAAMPASCRREGSRHGRSARFVCCQPQRLFRAGLEDRVSCGQSARMRRASQSGHRIAVRRRRQAFALRAAQQAIDHPAWLPGAAASHRPPRSRRETACPGMPRVSWAKPACSSARISWSRWPSGFDYHCASAASKRARWRRAANTMASTRARSRGSASAGNAVPRFAFSERPDAARRPARGGGDARGDAGAHRGKSRRAFR